MSARSLVAVIPGDSGRSLPTPLALRPPMWTGLASGVRRPIPPAPAHGDSYFLRDAMWRAAISPKTTAGPRVEPGPG